VPVRGLPPAASSGGGAAAGAAGAGEEQCQLKGGGEQEAQAHGPAPARGTPRAIPLPKCSMVCGGASHEHGHPADLLTRVPRLDQAIASLLPELSHIYSPLADPTKWTPVASVYGVRALAPRQQEGRIPFAGRVTSTHSAYTRLSPPPPGGLWIFTGLGSRGLIHHSILAEHLATAILENDASKLPGDVRQLALLRKEDSNPQT
jgi:glycine/D-amino acid oxidase-like deaminating enzyme